MQRRLFVTATALLFAALPMRVATGQAPAAGERWVAAGLTRGGPFLWLAVILGPDSILEIPFPNPSQGDPRWRMNNGRLETWDHRTGDTTSQEFTVSGDTLTIRGRPPIRRVAKGPAGHPPITGTWVTGQGRRLPLVYYYTYRSDGRMIQDISGRDSTWWKGDTLFLVGRGQRRSLAFRKTTDTLYVTGLDGHVHPFVRKPWGCYGTEEADRGVLECQ